MKTIQRVQQAPAMHWVGDGFPVRSMFSYQRGAEAYSPFLLLDHAARTEFPPNESNHRRGVGVHPHRGFETVTVVFDGEVAHRDSAGNGGVIGAGDVQWMTAAGGILHEEFHSEAYSRSGGPFQMVQLWVNLPAREKMSPPRYQALLKSDIPLLPLSMDGLSRLSVIAGACAPSHSLSHARALESNTMLAHEETASVRGPAHTTTPMNVWNIELRDGEVWNTAQPQGWTCLMMVMGGRIRVNDSQTASESELVVMSREGDAFSVRAEGDARVLLLAGEPIDEPIFGYGPFVMNTRQEIDQAIKDFNSGKFGTL